MILSMTGYGRARQVLNGREITVELRGVNARFLEYSSRLPRAFAFLEDPLKKLVAARVSRGKVELSLTVQNTTAADTVVTVNWPLAKGYRDAMTALSEQLELKNDMSVSLIARMPDVLAQTAAPLDEEALWADVQAVAGQAVDAFLTMRAAEGEKLKADLLSHLDVVEAGEDWIYDPFEPTEVNGFLIGRQVIKRLGTKKVRASGFPSLHWGSCSALVKGCQANREGKQGSNKQGSNKHSSNKPTRPRRGTGTRSVVYATLLKRLRWFYCTA